MNILSLLIYAGASFRVIGFTDALVVLASGAGDLQVTKVTVGSKSYAKNWKDCGWVRFTAPFDILVLPGVSLAKTDTAFLALSDGSGVSCPASAVNQGMWVLVDGETGTICILTSVEFYGIEVTQNEKTVWSADLTKFWEGGGILGLPSGTYLLKSGDCGHWGYWASEKNFGKGKLQVVLTRESGDKVTVSLEVQ